MDLVEILEEFFIVVGRFFKRFDWESCWFVFNIKEYYFDD